MTNIKKICEKAVLIKIMGEIIMFAVVQGLGKQYKVQPGQFIRMEKLELKEGAVWKSPVLTFQDSKGKLYVGQPFVEKVEVVGKVCRHGRSKKVLVFKKNRRKGYRRTQGHRQDFTEVYVELIKTPTGNIKQPKKLLKKG